MENAENAMEHPSHTLVSGMSSRPDSRNVRSKWSFVFDKALDKLSSSRSLSRQLSMCLTHTLIYTYIYIYCIYI